jgi:hypothetical protein
MFYGLFVLICPSVFSNRPGDFFPGHAYVESKMFIDVSIQRVGFSIFHRRQKIVNIMVARM